MDASDLRELKELRRTLNREKQKYDHTIRQVNAERAALKLAKEELTAAEEAQTHLQGVAQAVQEVAHQQIATIVSRCLTAVFDEPYRLEIEFARKRGKTDATFVYWKGENRLSPKVTSGGVRQIVSFALRLVKLLLEPGKSKTLFLDEPFGGLDSKNLPRAAMLLESLSKELGIQFIIATHSEHLEVGKVIRL